MNDEDATSKEEDGESTGACPLPQLDSQLDLSSCDFTSYQAMPFFKLKRVLHEQLI